MKKSILEVVHESEKGLFDIGLMDVQTMHSFDLVFAEYLNASLLIPSNSRELEIKQEVTVI